MSRNVAQALLPAVSPLLWIRLLRGNYQIGTSVGMSADKAGRSACATR